MAHINNNAIQVEEIKEHDAGQAAGGYDLHRASEPAPEGYAWVGITHERNTWNKDRYFCLGKQISRKKAEEIYKKYRNWTLPPTEDQLRAMIE